MKRKIPHKLAPNRRNTTPQHYIFVDTETRLLPGTGGKTYHSLRLGVAKYLRSRRDGKPPKTEVLKFICKEQFWEFVDAKAQKKSVLYVIAHNVVYDMLILEFMAELTKREWKCISCYEKGLTFIAKWRKPQHTLIILDNANWFQGKLEKWGEVLGLLKLPMPLETDDDNTWFVYCERDVDILVALQKWLVNFILENDLGQWAMTLPSVSLNSFRHRFMTHPVYIPAITAETPLARESYHGGRVECFYRGENTNGPFYKLDVNSMYPYVMKEFAYPTCFEGLRERPTLDDLALRMKKSLVIADVILKADLPFFVYKYNGRNIYPTGYFKTTLTTPELVMALDKGYIVGVNNFAYYRARYLFREFVNFFYDKRMEYKQQGDVLRTTLFKLALNSLYGKFGQQSTIEQVIGKAPIGTWKTSYGLDIVTGERYVIKQVGENIIRSMQAGESFNSFVAIAAHVTAYARIYLYTLVLIAGRDNVYYCDTDSLIVNELGIKRLSFMLAENELGRLKIEGVSNTIKILAPKHYLFDGKWTRKGIRANAVETSTNTYEQETWPGLSKFIGVPGQSYYTYKQEKKLNPLIETGIVLDNGHVAPLEIWES